MRLSLQIPFFTGAAQVPMFLDKFDRYGWSFWYAPLKAPPKQEETYDFRRDYDYARRTGVGLQLQINPSHQDTAEGVIDTAQYSWAVNLAREKGVPVFLQPMLTGPMWVRNQYPAEMQLRMPQCVGNYYSPGAWHGGDEPAQISFLGWGPDAKDLQGTWQVAWDESLSAEQLRRWASPQMDDAAWTTVVAPGDDRAVRLPDKPAVYRRSFDLPAAKLDSLQTAGSGKVYLYVWDLEQLRGDQQVAAAINGTLAGTFRPNSHLVSWCAFEVSQPLRAGRNQLALRLPRGHLSYRIYLSPAAPMINAVDYFQNMGEITWAADLKAWFEANQPLVHLFGKYHGGKARVAVLHGARSAQLGGYPWSLLRNEALGMTRLDYAGMPVEQWLPYPRDIVVERDFARGNADQYQVIFDTRCGRIGSNRPRR
jgi:hypothetical protein